MQMSFIHQHAHHLAILTSCGQFVLAHVQSCFCAPSPPYHPPYQYPLSHSHFLSFISERPRSDLVQLAPMCGGPFSSKNVVASGSPFHVSQCRMCCATRSTDNLRSGDRLALTDLAFIKQAPHRMHGHCPQPEANRAEYEYHPLLTADGHQQKNLFLKSFLLDVKYDCRYIMSANFDPNSSGLKHRSRVKLGGNWYLFKNIRNYSASGRATSFFILLPINHVTESLVAYLFPWQTNVPRPVPAAHFGCAPRTL